MLEFADKVECTAQEIIRKLGAADEPALLNFEQAEAIAKALLDPDNATSGALRDVLEPYDFTLETSRGYAVVEVSTETCDPRFSLGWVHAGVRPEHFAFAEGESRCLVAVEW